MAIDTALPPTPAPGHLGGARPPGRTTDRAFRILAFAAGFLVLVILVLIAYSTISKAWPAFRDEGLDYFTSDTWDPAHAAFGTLAFSFGTLVISVIALLVSVPISIGIALFVTELSPRWMRRPIVTLVDLLAAVPSVVYGLWGLLVLVPALPGFYQDWHDLFAGVPVLGGLFDGDPIAGKAFMTAGLILAIMITPIITAVTRETFTTVPQAQKDAALAMGATRWEMIRAAVFPHSRSGMTAAILIGLGRAMGETIAVALVIGSSPQITEKLFSSGDALPAVIVNQFGESTGTYQAALIGMGVVLFFLTLIIGVIARTALARADRKLGAP
ncbi:MAG TPA: phosphate ABC transporter permease subunit PstC [Acidimicrobiia bacterium]